MASNTPSTKGISQCNIGKRIDGLIIQCTLGKGHFCDHDFKRIDDEKNPRFSNQENIVCIVVTTLLLSGLLYMMINGMLKGTGLLIQGGASIVVVLSGVAWLVGTGSLISNLLKQRSVFWIKTGTNEIGDAVWKPFKNTNLVGSTA